MRFFPDDIKIQRLDPDIQYNSGGPIVKMIKDDKGDYVTYEDCCRVVEEAGWPSCPICWDALEMEKDEKGWRMVCGCSYKSQTQATSRLAFQNARQEATS